MLRLVAPLALLFVFAFISSFATAQTLKPHHQNAKVPCASCHLDGMGKPAPEKACLSCHGSREAIAAKTEKHHPNPHFGHDDDITCSSCHREHQASLMPCLECHDVKVKTP